MRNHKNCLLDLLDANTENYTQNLTQELLNLIVKCVQCEQNFICTQQIAPTWGVVFKKVTSTLKISDTQNFYNLGKRCVSVKKTTFICFVSILRQDSFGTCARDWYNWLEFFGF